MSQRSPIFCPMINLYDAKLKPGTSVVIEALEGEELVVERLHEMGLRLGTLVTVMGSAPFRGPLLVKYKSTLIALRKEEAQCTRIKIPSDKLV